MRRPSRTEALMPVLSANKAQEEQINTSYEPLTPSVITDEKAQSYIEALNFACSHPGYQKYCSNRAVRGR